MKLWLGVCVLSLVLGVADAADSPTTVPESLYVLPIKLVNQAGKTVSLDLYRGQPVIITMFYASCPGACPLLIESIRATEAVLAPHVRSDVRVLLVSIDPQRDTPAALLELARTRHVDTSRWMLVSAPAADVRTLAAALNVQYRRLPDGEFNHTSVLTLLTRDGEITEQSSVLGKSDAKFVTAINRAAARR